MPPTAEVLRLVREAREARREGRPAALLVPNRIDPKAHYDDVTREAFACLRERWAPSINLHVEHGSAFARGCGSATMRRSSDAASEMLALAMAVEERLGLPVVKGGPVDDEAELTRASA